MARKLLLFSIILLSLFLVGCGEKELPPFPDAPIGEGLKAIQGKITVTPINGFDVTSAFSDRGVDITLEPGDGDIYAVYRFIGLDNAYTSSLVGNAFPTQSSTYTAITTTYPTVTGTLDLSSITNTGDYPVAIAAYRLKNNNQWDTSKFYQFSTTIHVVVPECAGDTELTQCTGDNLEACFEKRIYETKDTCGNKGCFEDSRCGDCDRNATLCDDDVTRRSCDTQGHWETEVCSFLCSNGQCVYAPSSPYASNTTGQSPTNISTNVTPIINDSNATVAPPGNLSGNGT